MRALKNINGKWVAQNPESLLDWMTENRLVDAVVVDDDAQIYYCANDALVDIYKNRWAKERRKGDIRKAATFSDLYQRFETVPPDFAEHPLWCPVRRAACTEKNTGCTSCP